MNNSSFEKCYLCNKTYLINAGDIINIRCAEIVPGSFHRNEYVYTMKPQWICIYCQMQILDNKLKELEKKLEKIKKTHNKLGRRISIQSIRNK